MRQRRRTVFLVLLVSITTLVLVQRNQQAGNVDAAGSIPAKEKTGQNAASEPAKFNSADKQGGVEFNRKLDKIIYSRHGRCRMDCRNIDEYEIKEIRDKGKINWEKSDLKAKGDPRFALEGITRDKQLVRVVFAQTDDALVLVTCIDLNTDWTCHCN